MRFMLIARATPLSESGLPPDPRLMAAIGELMAREGARGRLIGGEGLAPSAQGALGKLKNGKITFTDGPYAEAKELVGGYAIVRVKDKAEALEMAREFLQVHADVLGPAFEMYSEIRQIHEFEDVAPSPGAPEFHGVPAN